MNWWRAHHGISHDTKLALVAKRAEAKRCEVLAIWVSLLDYASQQEERGTISGLDHEELAFQTDVPLEVVERVIAQLRDKEMLTGDNLTAWGKRQYNDSSTERVKRHRQNKGLSLECNGVKRSVTVETLDVTHETVLKRPDTDTDTDTEQIQKPARVLEMPTFEKDRDEAWVWFLSEYPGDLHEEHDCQIFMSVVQAFEDIVALRKNLPLWKGCENWQKGFIQSAENFLRKRIFRDAPKTRAPTEEYVYKPPEGGYFTGRKREISADESEPPF